MARHPQATLDNWTNYVSQCGVFNIVEVGCARIAQRGSKQLPVWSLARRRRRPLCVNDHACVIRLSPLPPLCPQPRLLPLLPLPPSPPPRV